MNKIRGIQINKTFHCKIHPDYIPIESNGFELKEIIIDCNLGSLIITKKELIDYLKNRYNNEKCVHIDNIGNCCKTVGHKPCTCKEQLSIIKKRG